MDALQIHYFDVLGLQPTSNLQTIREAYMKKAKQLHPDKTGSKSSTSAMQGVIEAWEALHERCPTSSQIDDYNRKSKTQTEGQTEPKTAMVLRGALLPWIFMVGTTAISLLVAILFEYLDLPQILVWLPLCSALHGCVILLMFRSILQDDLPIRKQLDRLGELSSDDLVEFLCKVLIATLEPVWLTPILLILLFSFPGFFFGVVVLSVISDTSGFFHWSRAAYTVANHCFWLKTSAFFHALANLSTPAQ